MTTKTRHPESVAKCACGKVMRLKDRGEHNKACSRSAVQVTSQDVDALLRDEAQTKKVDAK